MITNTQRSINELNAHYNKMIESENFTQLIEDKLKNLYRLNKKFIYKTNVKFYLSYVSYAAYEVFSSSRLDLIYKDIELHFFIALNSNTGGDYQYSWRISKYEYSDPDNKELYKLLDKDYPGIFGCCEERSSPNELIQIFNQLIKHTI